MDELIVVKSEELKIDVVKWNAYSIQAEREAAALVITCDEEEGMAVDTLSDIKSNAKAGEEARKADVGPFNKLVDRINDAYRPYSESLKRAETAIKDKIKFYGTEKERVRQIEEAKRLKEYQEKIAAEQAEAKAKGEEARIVAPPPAIMPAAQTTHGSIGAATRKKFYNYEVTDIAALYAARPDLVTLEPKRRDILAAIKDGKEIKGLRVFQDTDISAR